MTRMKTNTEKSSAPEIATQMGLAVEPQQQQHQTVHPDQELRDKQAREQQPQL